MEVQYSIIIAVIFVGALLLGIFRVLNWIWFQPKKFERRLKAQGVKGNPYRLLLGDLKEMKKLHKEARLKPIGFSDAITPRVLPALHDIVQKYGKSSYVWLGPNVMAMVMDPENINNVTMKHFIFQKPHINFIQGLSSYEGDKWVKHRKILNPAFHLEKLKHMLPAVHISTMETISKWDAMVSPKGSSEVDVWPYLQTLTCDAISRAAFGSNYEEGKRISELQRELATLILSAVQSLFIPGLRFLPTKVNRRMKSVTNQVNDSVRSIVEARMKAMREGEALGDDLLGTLVESNLKEINEHGNKDFGMTIQDIIEECKLFYFAGQETTSVLLVWTMVLLSKYPHWQTRAREEVVQLFGDEKPDFDGLNHLKIVTMILYEVLRLYPPVPEIRRKTTHETKLGKLTLPAGVVISLPIMLMHHDTELWGGNASEFRPERFAKGLSHATKGQVIFFPFGWGPRTCIGQNFAMLEAKMALALILQRFTFELSPSYSHAPIAVFTLQPQHGAHLILHKI